MITEVNVQISAAASTYKNELEVTEETATHKIPDGWNYTYLFQTDTTAKENSLHSETNGKIKLNLTKKVHILEFLCDQRICVPF